MSFCSQIFCCPTCQYSAIHSLLMEVTNFCKSFFYHYMFIMYWFNIVFGLLFIYVSLALCFAPLNTECKRIFWGDYSHRWRIPQISFPIPYFLFYCFFIFSPPSPHSNTCPHRYPWSWEMNYYGWSFHVWSTLVKSLSHSTFPGTFHWF